MTEFRDYPLGDACTAAEVRELGDHRQGNTAYVLTSLHGRATHDPHRR
jgi:hypothetical protein